MRYILVPTDVPLNLKGLLGKQEWFIFLVVYFFSGVLFSSDVVYVVCTFVCARGVGKKLPATCCMRPACQNAKNVDYLTIYVPPGRQNNRP